MGGGGGGGAMRQIDRKTEKGAPTYKIRKKQDSLVQFNSAFKMVSRRSG